MQEIRTIGGIKENIFIVCFTCTVTARLLLIIYYSAVQVLKKETDNTAIERQEKKITHKKKNTGIGR